MMASSESRNSPTREKRMVFIPILLVHSNAR
jgi:hypothetical protein